MKELISAKEAKKMFNQEKIDKENKRIEEIYWNKVVDRINEAIKDNKTTCRINNLDSPGIFLDCFKTKLPGDEGIFRKRLKAKGYKVSWIHKDDFEFCYYVDISW